MNDYCNSSVLNRASIVSQLESSASVLSFGSKSIHLAPQRENSIHISPETVKPGTTVYNLGDVPTGGVGLKEIEIKNNKAVCQRYRVMKDPGGRALDNFIEVVSGDSNIQPGDTFHFKIIYSPKIPSAINVDYYNVFDSEGICLAFAAKGRSIGPCLKTSDKKLTFICPFDAPEKKRKKTIEFSNESSVAAKYCYDVDMENTFFRPDTLNGMVQPNSYAYAVVTFCPPEPGIFSKELFCLIYNQAPIVIKMEGVCLKVGYKLAWTDLNLSPIPQPFSVKHGYDWFFENERQETVSRHVLSIREWNLDFGATQVGVEELPKRFIVQNSSKKRVLVKWFNEHEKVFTIWPLEHILESYQFCVFEVRFRPTEEEKLYSVEMNGFGYWDYNQQREIDALNKRIVYMPIDITVRAMGHTFPEGSHGWIPRYIVTPSRVRVATCVPPISSYSTFVLKRVGQLPFSFKFIPPPDTCFSVRPKQGLVVVDFRIIVVQFQPRKTTGPVNELWTIRFNGTPDHDDKIRFSGYAEFPILTTETDPVNVVNFPATHPGCVGYIDVPVRNLTRHCIRYKFLSTETLTRVTMEGGETVIGPNEVLTQTWSFVPHETGVREIEVTLEAIVMQDCLYPISSPVESPIMTIQHSQVTELVAYPRVLEFGPSLLESKKRGTFRLYNFGVCAIHYQLTSRQCNMILEECEDDVDVLERWDTVPPKSFVEVEVDLRPTQWGLQEFSISYQVRLSVRSMSLIEVPPKEVIRLNYEGILPRMRVVEVQFNAANKLWHKNWAWATQNLHGLNEAMATSMPNARVTVNMNFPESQLGSESLTIYLYLKNTGELVTDWSLKRKQRCQCKLIEKDRGISFRDKLFECPHRELFTVVGKLSGSLKTREITVWTIVINYSLAGSHQLVYTLRLSNNRKIYLLATVSVLPAEITRPSMLTDWLSLDNTYLGDMQPTLQLFWLYNNCSADSEYEVDTAPLGNINAHPFNVNILECLNPKGVVRKGRFHAIYFKFDPYRFNGYETSVPLRLGGETVDLRIAGLGGIKYEEHPKRLDVPPGGEINTPEMPLVFSLDHIFVRKSIPTHTQIERIFFLRNQTAQTYGYEWHELKVSLILHAKVSPSKGVLQPFESILCKMTISTGGHPALVNTGFSIETFNLTETRLYERSLFIFREVNRQLEGEFIISKDGLSLPVNQSSILPKPKPWEITMGVKCHIISPIDMDMKVPLRNQLKHAPGMEIDLSNRAKPPDMKPLEHEKITDELEKILWDSMSSKWMQETIFTFSNNDHVYYSQIFMTRQEERNQRERTFVVPSRRLVKLILNNIIYQVIQELFGYARVADDSDLAPNRETFRSPSSVWASQVDLRRHDGEVNTKPNRYRIGSDLGLKIKIPDAW